MTVIYDYMFIVQATGADMKRKTLHDKCTHFICKLEILFISVQFNLFQTPIHVQYSELINVFVIQLW